MTNKQLQELLSHYADNEEIFIFTGNWPTAMHEPVVGTIIQDVNTSKGKGRDKLGRCYNAIVLTTVKS